MAQGRPKTAGSLYALSPQNGASSVGALAIREAIRLKGWEECTSSEEEGPPIEILFAGSFETQLAFNGERRTGIPFRRRLHGFEFDIEGGFRGSRLRLNYSGSGTVRNSVVKAGPIETPLTLRKEQLGLKP